MEIEKKILESRDIVSKINEIQNIVSILKTNFLKDIDKIESKIISISNKPKPKAVVTKKVKSRVVAGKAENIRTKIRELLSVESLTTAELFDKIVACGLCDSETSSYSTVRYIIVGMKRKNLIYQAEKKRGSRWDLVKKDENKQTKTDEQTKTIEDSNKENKQTEIFNDLI